jgi:hypothetical protein
MNMNYTVQHTTQYPGTLQNKSDLGYRFTAVVDARGYTYGFHSDPDGSNVRSLQVRSPKQVKSWGWRRCPSGTQAKRKPFLEAAIKAYLATNPVEA